MKTKPVSKRIPNPRAELEEKVFQGALAIIAKHKALKEAEVAALPPKVTKVRKQHDPNEVIPIAILSPKYADKLAKLSRGNTVQYQGKAYMFFRLNKQKQAILITQDGEERITVDPTQLT